MSGAQAPVYTDEAKAEAVRLVIEEKLSYREAEKRTGVNSSTVSNEVGKWRQRNVPDKPDGPLAVQVADYAERLSSIAHSEITTLEAKKAGQVSLEQLEKALKVVAALDKLAKSHPGDPGSGEPKPDSKVAELAADLPPESEAA